MTIEFNSFFGSVSNSIYSTTGLNHIFSSVLYTSLSMTIIIIIMVLLIYPARENSPSWIVVKLFLYVFGGVLAIFSVHGSFIKNDYKEKCENNRVNNLMNSIHGGKFVYNGDSIPVQPNLEHVEEHEEREEHEEERFKTSKPISLSAMIDDLEKKV